jgi:hypothetical protein
MQDHPIDGASGGARERLDHHHQLKRWLLLELASSPPAAGDDLDYLAAALKDNRSHVESAVEALVADGLADREGECVRASLAAWRFDALWPIRA